MNDLNADGEFEIAPNEIGRSDANSLTGGKCIQLTMTIAVDGIESYKAAVMEPKLELALRRRHEEGAHKRGDDYEASAFITDGL